MTIAIGVLCSDGIVMGADSKESGYQTKVYRPKIFELDIVSDDIKGVLAGSGDADFLDALKEKIEEAIDRAAPTLASVQSKVETAIQSYCRKIWPLYGQTERPQAEILIGLHTPQGQALLHTNGPIVRAAHRPYESIGFGADFSTYFLKKLFTNDVTVERATPLAIHVLDLVKKNVESCGGESHVFVISGNGTIEGKDKTYIDNTVASFEDFLTASDRLLARSPSLRFNEKQFLVSLNDLYDSLPTLEEKRVATKGLEKAIMGVMTSGSFEKVEQEIGHLLTKDEFEEIKVASATFTKFAERARKHRQEEKTPKKRKRKLATKSKGKRSQESESMKLPEKD